MPPARLRPGRSTYHRTSVTYAGVAVAQISREVGTTERVLSPYLAGMRVPKMETWARPDQARPRPNPPGKLPAEFHLNGDAVHDFGLGGWGHSDRHA